MGWSLALLRLTVNTNDVVPLLPSLCDTTAGVIEMTGWVSSLVMVPVPVAVVMVALVAFVTATVKVSVGSNLVSPLNSTVTVCDAHALAGNVSVRDVAL